MAVFLAFAVLCVPMCPAQSCAHACCPSQSGSCAGASAHLMPGCVCIAPDVTQKQAAGLLVQPPLRI